MNDRVSCCQLLPAGGSHALVNLEDGRKMIIGRSTSTSILDSKCSRQQIEVCATYDKKQVHIKQLGNEPSKVATKVLQKGDTFILGEDDWLELIQGNYRYHVHFSVSNHESEEPPPQKKLKICEGATKPTQRCLSSFGVCQSKVSEADISPVWKEHDTLLIFESGQPMCCSKIASFDLDNTIIQTASGKKFPTSRTDWKFMTRVVDKLRSFVAEGFKIVIFSNQLGISKGKVSKEDFRHKIESIAKKLQIPFLLMASLAKDNYRKPCIGMWQYMITHQSQVADIDMGLSFYVGDAAGRLDNWMSGKKKDFSCTDRKFSANLSLPFFTPEEKFLDYPKCNSFSWGLFNPTTLIFKAFIPPSTSDSQEMIVFVGYPASGKTSFFTRHLKPVGYHHVNRDTLGSWQKCVAACEELLKKGNKAVIDNTNPDIESRHRYINLAHKFSIPVRCFHFTTSLEHCKHNNRFRELTKTVSSKKVVNDIAFNLYKSKYIAPTSAEGFSDVIEIDFTPTFSDKAAETLYKMFLD